MKVKKANRIEPMFPLDYSCWQCGSFLEVEEEDLCVGNTLSERAFCGVECPVCGAIGEAPVSEAYASRFTSGRDWAGKFLGTVFSLGGLLK